jgi:hypothetical protein
MASRGSGSGDVVAITPPQMITDNSSAIEDDPSDLLGRVHHAIPDLELLLRRYKETHGELGLREALVRKKEAESAEVVKRKEEHIDRLMGQFHDAEKKHAREYNKLRLHIGNLEENMKDLEERLHVSESQRKKETASNKELSEEKIALVRERMLVAKAAADERDRLVADYENSRTDVCNLNSVSYTVLISMPGTEAIGRRAHPRGWTRRPERRARKQSKQHKKGVRKATEQHENGVGKATEQHER